MAFPHEDGWLMPPDEFSLDNPANTSNTGGRLVRLGRDNPRFAEGE
jgi:hypothetical protein